MRLLLAGLIAPLVTLGLLLFMATLVQQDDHLADQTSASPYLDLVMSDLEESLEHKVRRKPKPPEPKPPSPSQAVANSQPQPPNPATVAKPALPSLALTAEVSALAIPAPGVMSVPATAPALPSGPQNAAALPLVRVEPRYPARALRRGKEGYVILSFTINSAGRVEDIQVVEAQPENWFEEEAVRALRKWKYRPMRVDGQPVAQPGQTIKLDFVVGS